MTGLRTQLLLDFLSFVVVRRQIKQRRMNQAISVFTYSYWTVWFSGK